MIGANKVLNGADCLDKLLPLIKGKKIALVVNQTSVLKDNRTHLVDTLLAQKIGIKTIFAPEHGFRGTADAGETIHNETDKKTGLPIVSLYGKNKKPTAEQLQGIDAVIFDIQDVGARFYTYISTLYYVMEACADQHIRLIVLDRPNPNDYVDGPVIKDSLRSFVGIVPIPLLHGLTVGEFAQMVNGEHWLKSKEKVCPLQVIKVEGWKHHQPYSLPIKPSPNLPNDLAVSLYPSLCLFEATAVSVGRGTTYPFQVIGYPDKRFGSFTFTPVSLPGFDKNPAQKNRLCYGIDFRKKSFEGGFTLKFFLDYYKKSGQGALFFTQPRGFDQLMGTSLVRKMIIAGKGETEIKGLWQKELNKYKETRRKYLLYEETESR
nr:DUF1343 domain-containing protein [Parabacteroides sp. FAFU027]